jgi:7-keto-8-aminopelargonate synthetase-like enzyme
MPKYVLNSAAKPVIDIDSTSLIYFGGTNYLGLGFNTDIVFAAQEGIIRWGITSAGSRQITGGAVVHDLLEQCLADFLGCEKTCTIGSGYLSDLMVLQGVREEFDVALVDEKVHVSVTDAVHAVRMPLHTFKHRDPNALEKKLKKLTESGKRVLICADAVFPFGLISPLGEYQKLARQYGTMLMTNDSHGFGILGENGRGSVEYHGLGFDAVILNGSLSKAVGCYGGYTATTDERMQSIYKNSNAYIGSAPLPPAIAHASFAALEAIRKGTDLRKQLKQNVTAMKDGLRKIGVKTEDSPIPVVTFVIGDEERNMAIHNELYKKQILIPYIYYPGSPEGGCFRMAVTAQHSESQIRNAIDSLGEIINR